MNRHEMSGRWDSFEPDGSHGGPCSSWRQLVADAESVLAEQEPPAAQGRLFGEEVA